MDNLSQWRPKAKIRAPSRVSSLSLSSRSILFTLNTGLEYWLPSKAAAAIGCCHDISAFFDSLIVMKHLIS